MSTKEDHKNPVIWIIDDDDIIRFVMKKNCYFLQNGGIVEFPEASKPLDILNSNCENPEILPDLIFLDVNLPGIDGFGFMENYKLISSKLSKPIRIYMLSSSISNEEISRAKSIPEITDYLSKPLELSQLQTLLESA